MAHRWPEFLGRRVLTTGVGSLPHHNVDSALEFSFRHDIPFLPQIPVRNPAEFMIAQALEGVPGLRQLDRGEVSLDIDSWEQSGAKLVERLTNAFAEVGETKSPFADFLPSPSSYSALKPFLFELQERGSVVAKVQLAGPMTCQWVLRLSDGSAADRRSDVAMAIYRLVLARSLALVQSLTDIGVIPLVVLDEPAFYGFSRGNVRHVVGLQELRLTLQTLRKAGAVVGIHCCSHTDWDLVLGLGLDVLSVDAALALPGLIQSAARVREFLDRGGRFSWGVIPTSRGGEELGAFSLEEAVDDFSQQVSILGQGISAPAGELLSQGCLVTPACGLALHRSEAAEQIFGLLEQFRKRLRRA